MIRSNHRRNIEIFKLNKIQYNLIITISFTPHTKLEDKKQAISKK
ncbi:unnamed protein product [Paramecium octaurelia]|uniref:Uncharacterized protein n=1 Tax=Paramecium octaurelia TaxID=43137 RepID=A0A8S1VFL1_PAROT|nr:unnamed protein product [Paramecium octaurelia]